MLVAAAGAVYATAAASLLCLATAADTCYLLMLAGASTRGGSMARQLEVSLSVVQAVPSNFAFAG